MFCEVCESEYAGDPKPETGDPCHNRSPLVHDPDCQLSDLAVLTPVVNGMHVITAIHVALELHGDTTCSLALPFAYV